MGAKEKKCEKIYNSSEIDGIHKIYIRHEVWLEEKRTYIISTQIIINVTRILFIYISCELN
jgi:hypothetical protein